MDLNPYRPIPEHCEQFQTIQKPSGSYKTERLYSYVALLCQKGGGLTDAIRVDYCRNKAEASKKVKEELDAFGEYWNIKGIWRLYDEDFEDKPEKPVPDSLAAFMNPPEGKS